ncbi:unnamed protein product [Arabis nemorensis]|uniref:Uncharacterized protein n=1 Tax=Arabis nemorensis TaxID=586526 RepID=A0A565CP32_9BRAS|nr:unnamed protein product [Arabis nemorensis]
MAAPENPNSLQRVKVYRLTEDGKWDDRGTGHVSMDYMERSKELGLYVIDEDDNATLLVHRVSTEDIYRKQEDTIISWRDPERFTELALSFQETAGCSFVWDQISTMQRNLHFNSLNSETFHNVNSELRELPVVGLSSLPLILKIVTESGITDQMRLAELMLKDVSINCLPKFHCYFLYERNGYPFLSFPILFTLDFFPNLMKVFDICEDSKNIDGLHVMFSIVKRIISFNSPQILEKIVGDELIMKIIGCLEYNPDVPQAHQHHRNFLKEHVVFKEAIPIENPLVLSKIHQTYRIGYLKDVVLNRVIDDATAANLNSVINTNNATVIALLKDDNTFIQELFARLRSPSTSVESRNNLVDFLHEFCSLSKSLRMEQHLSVIRELMNKGIFDIIAEVLQSPDKNLVLTGAKILLIFVNVDANLLPSYIVRTEGTPLLGLLVKGMMEDFGDKMHHQFIEILKAILPSALSGGAQQANIMDIFCAEHLPELVDFITASCPERPGNTSEGASRRGGSDCVAKPEVLLNICELLSFCIPLDSFRTNFLHKNMTEKVLHLMRRKDKSVVAAAIRFLRTLLSLHDDNVQSYLVKNNILKPIIDFFVANGNQDNLPNSAVLELLEHIHKGNASVLIRYVVETFWVQLAPFEEKLASIQAFKKRYEQCLESKGPESTDPVDLRRNERASDKEEDNYVKENSDEEKSASASERQEEEAKAHSSNVVAGSCASSREDELEQSQRPRQRLCSTSEGNKNSPEQGGEAKEPENSSSSLDGEKDSRSSMES